MDTNTDCGCGRAYCDWNVGTCPQEPAGPLRRGKDDGGARDFLVGKPVQCGQPLDRLTGDVEAGRGKWVRVRYEAALFRDGPAMYVDDTGEHEATQRDRFRWPLPGAAAGDLFDRAAPTCACGRDFPHGWTSRCGGSAP